MIRTFEKLYSGSHLSTRASGNGRVPIFAVSASLVERERQTYINAGFDGWILKPIDFKRLNVLLLGLVEDDTRHSCLYRPCEWERGGWFNRRQPLVIETSAVPSEKSPVQSLHPGDVAQSDPESHHSSESGSTTPKMGNQRKPLIDDERLDTEAGMDGFFSAMENKSAKDVTSDSTT
jgi:hypothetical protein